MVIADDHPIVRMGLAGLIDAESNLVVCGQASNAAEALSLVDRESPDLAVVDLALGESSGLDLIKQLAHKSVDVLVVSMQDDALWAERALAAGARGYVHKSEATAHVIDAIHVVRSGRSWVSESISEQLVARMVARSPRDNELEPITTLSDRELEVFDRIGRGLSTRQIAEALGVSPKTVQTHRERIKRKLGLETAAELSTAASRWVASH